LLNTLVNGEEVFILFIVVLYLWVMMMVVAMARSLCFLMLKLVSFFD
jgi:hypothetical protein